MANLKISNLNTETNLSNVLGLAGYNASETIKISGADIISSVGSAINTLYTSNGALSGDRIINANNHQCNFNNVRGMQITSNGSPIQGVIFDVRNIGGGSILAVGDTNDNVLITGGISSTLTFEPSSALEVRSTTQGFLKPVMTGAQVEAISTPATGLEAYATSAGAGDVTGAGWWGYNGSNWVQINGGGSTPTLQNVVNTDNVIRNVSGDTNIIKINDGNVLQSIEIGGTGNTFGIEGVPGTNVNITTATGQSVTLGSTTSNRRLNIFNDFGGFTDAIFEDNCNAQFKGKIKDYAGDEGTPNKALMISESSGGGYLANSIRWKNPNGELILLPDTPDQDIYNDGNIYIKLNDLTTDDIQIQILTNPASGSNVTFTWESNGASPTSGGNSINVLSGLTNANTDFDAYHIMRMTVYAPADTTYPYYEFVFTKGAGGTNFVTRVTKWDSIS